MQETVSSTSEKFDLASFFAGVGGIELGFEQTGEFSTVYANEFDKHARETYRHNFPDVELEPRDIRDVHADEVPQVDVITGGFPCQAFSIAGYRLGFEDDRGDLFFELLRIIKSKRPRVIFIENVKNMVGHDHGNTFKVIREALVINGYSIKWRVLNGMEYGNIPQNRERIYIVGFLYEDDYRHFEFPQPLPLKTELTDIIDFDQEVDEYFYYRPDKQKFYDQLEEEIISNKTVYQWRRRYVRENKSGVVPTLTANMGTGGHNVPLILGEHGIRKLTPRETFNAQGYPKDFIIPTETARSHIYKQAGNSVVVPVIRRIAENIIEAMEKTEETSIETMEPTSNNKYAVIEVGINHRYAGESQVQAYFDSYDDANDYIRKNSTVHQLHITDEQYLKIINKNQSGNFLMLVEL